MRFSIYPERRKLIMGKYSNETGGKKAEIWFKLVPNLSWFDSYWKFTPDSGHLIGHCWSMFKEEGGKVLVVESCWPQSSCCSSSGKSGLQSWGWRKLFLSGAWSLGAKTLKRNSPSLVLYAHEEDSEKSTFFLFTFLPVCFSFSAFSRLGFCSCVVSWWAIMCDLEGEKREKWFVL